MREIQWRHLSSILTTSKEAAAEMAETFRRRHELSEGKRLQVRVFECTVKGGGTALKCWLVVARVRDFQVKRIPAEKPESHLLELGIFFRLPNIGAAYKVERRLRWFLARFGWLLGIRDEWALSGVDLIPSKKLGTPRGLR